MPDTPHALWARGELDDILHLPEGSRVDFIGVGDGCFPDIVVLDADMFRTARKDKIVSFVPDQIEMVAFTCRNPSASSCTNQWEPWA